MNASVRLLRWLGIDSTPGPEFKSRAPHRGRISLWGGGSEIRPYYVPRVVFEMDDNSWPKGTFARSELMNVTIGGAERIGDSAFEFCENLTNVTMIGDVTSIGARAASPHPTILDFGDRFGPSLNGYSFVISWATNVPVVAEASADLNDLSWTLIATETLTDGWVQFTDPEWQQHPARFYRVRGQ